MNTEKLNRLPDSVLTDITADPETAAPPAANPDPVTPGNSEVDKKDLFETGSTAANNPHSGASVNPISPISPNVPMPGTGKPITAGQMVSGKFATDLMDSLIPAVMVLLVSTVGYEMDKKGLQLKQTEKDLIAPAMQTYLDSIRVDLNNPFYNLLMVIGVVYGSKIIEQLPNMKKKAKPAKVVSMSDSVNEFEKKVEESKARELKLKKENDALKKMSPGTAVKWLMENRKISKAKAMAWFNKNLTA